MSTPEQIGRHRILEPLGVGGFATVWRGYDAELDADVAVKVLAENWAARADIRSRFVDEARLLRRADSDRVVRVHDIGTLPDGRPYFVMSYADGGTLADRLTGEPVPVDEALRLAEESARAVGVLHELGVLHRDVKPSNVLFRRTPTGEQVMIADLGLAKAVANASGITLSAGTPGYMPPEQVDPAGGLDRRVDVYALGALTYQLLTGTVPESPGSAAGRLVPPGRLRPGLPPGTDATVLRALSADREHRWPDAGAYADALRRLATAAHRVLTTVTDAPPTPSPVAEPTVTAAPYPRAPYGHPPAPFTPPPPPDRRRTPRPPRRSRRRRLVTTAIVVGSALAIFGAGFGGYEYWGSQVSTVRPDEGQVSIRIPNYWRVGFTHTRIASLTRFGGTGKGLRLSTEPDPDAISYREGITLVAGRGLPRTPAATVLDRAPPIRNWMPASCQAGGVDRPSRNPVLHGTVRTWISGSCTSSSWYGEAVLRGPGYGVLVYMKGQSDGPGGKTVFDDAVTSLRVDARSLPH